MLLALCYKYSMSFRESSQTQPEQEKPPQLLQLEQLSSNPESATPYTLLYCPPLYGTVPSDDHLGNLKDHFRSIYTVDVQAYGYPQVKEYITQIIAQLNNLTAVDIKNLHIAGFSEGATIAAFLGKSLGIPPENVFLFAPITSFAASLDRWRALKEQRNTRTQEAPPADINTGYLRRLFRAILAKEKMYSPSGKVSRLQQFKNLERSRVQWALTNPDQRYGKVVQGTRDFISPPENSADFVIEATHQMPEFLAFLQRHFSATES